MSRRPAPRGDTPERPATPASPIFVSQLTSLAVLGIDARRYLESLVPRCGRVARVGKLRLVALADAVAALQSLTAANDTTTEAPEPIDADQPRSVDDVLRAVGHELAR